MNNQQQAIKIRSIFSGWHEVSMETAKDYALWKFHNMTTMNEEGRANHVNKSITGVQFSLEELRGC
jgi:hypothetical protein